MGLHTGIHIEGHAAPASPETLNEVGEQLVRILSVGFETHADQATIQRALAILERASEGVVGAQNMTISGCHLDGGDRPTTVLTEADFEEIDPDA